MVTPRRFMHASRLLLLIPALLVAVAGPWVRADEEKPPVGDLAMERILRHGVNVSFRFQRDLEGEEWNAVPPDRSGREERYRFWRLSYVVPGFVIRDRRTVLVSDPWIAPGAVASVTVQTPSGETVRGRLRGFLREVEAVIIETDADLPLEPLTLESFQAVGEEASPAPRIAGSLAEGADGYDVWVEALGGGRHRPIGDDGTPGYGMPETAHDGIRGTGGDGARTVDLVLDGEARPLGFRFGAALPPGSRWRGPDVLAAEEVSLAGLRAQARAFGEASVLHRVKVAFRTQSRHDRDASPIFFGPDDADEEEFWGVAVTAEFVVVPGALEDDQIRKIRQVRIADDEGPGLDASFVGRLPGYEAFLVRVEDAPLTPVAAEAPPVPSIGEAILVHQLAWRGGRRRDQIDYNRVTGWGRGYGDRRFLGTEREVVSGAFLRSVDGKLLGFAAVLDPEDRERSLGEERRPGRTRSVFHPVAVLFQDVGLPETLAAAPDTRVMPQEEAEAHRSPWLGVEYDAIDEGVAELLDVSSPTRDGGRGLIVIRVYEDSPADRAGLEEGDILLSVQRTSGPGGPPVDLRDTGGGGMFGFFPWQGSSAPWRTRSNALVQLLKDWGVGTTYTLAYLRDGREAEAPFTVEMAPPDFASAPRIFDSATGLEVRDLTFEVKRALRMPNDATGVVTARIETGSPAAQARIEENELILEFEGVPILDAAHFARLLDEARSGGREQVRVVVRRLG
ncbi:MAG: PDZ domain-containing protein, partial [Planctomycetota bacterium]